MRIVLDSSILVRAFVTSNGLAHELLLAILAGDHSVILSDEMLFEGARVLRSPRPMVVHGQCEEAIYNFTGWLRASAEVIVLNRLEAAPIRDQNDIFVLQTALSAEAAVLCTSDRDFFEPPASIFLPRVGIAVLKDDQLMHIL